MSFARQMHRANNLLSSHRLLEACAAYKKALTLASNDSEKRYVWRMVGMAERMNGHDYAHRPFGGFAGSMMSSGTVAHLLGIDTVVAIYRIETGYSVGSSRREREMRQTVGRIENDLATNRISLQRDDLGVEVAASDGYLGRLEFIAGDRARGRALIELANVTLSDTSRKDYNPSHELHNLAWLARSSTRARFRFALRAYRLSRETSSASAWREYRAILLYGDRIYRIRKRRKRAKM